ncbi:MAG: endonuclease III domain-containing protein [Candidatus Omnitrophica bacterium]|nr:endonuclease III domain-containing protein [Candidatus Omnitrophota bacterium]MBU1933168.1 endonuclease III domain-containing protein [Candidatus Omnitrophota bacterium]
MKKAKKTEKLLRIYELLFEKFGPRHWWPGDTRLEIIVGAILTQNTAWSNVEKAIVNLKKEKALNARRLSGISEKRLSTLIKPAGYFNVKARRLKNFLSFLNLSYGGSLDRMFKTDTWELREQLLKVSGIGPETADSILLYAGHKPVFVVDAYTKRVFSRHGFINDSAAYEEVQGLLMKNLPAEEKLFNEFHALIVELGKNICRPAKPLCHECPIRRIKNG